MYERFWQPVRQYDNVEGKFDARRFGSMTNGLYLSEPQCGHCPAPPSRPAKLEALNGAGQEL